MIVPSEVQENNIAVFAHDLHDQILAAKIAKLIQMLDCKMNDPLQFGLPDIHDPAVCNVLSQKHTVKLGAVMGLGLFASVRYMSGRDALAGKLGKAVSVP